MSNALFEPMPPAHQRRVAEPVEHDTMGASGPGRAAETTVPFHGMSTCSRLYGARGGPTGGARHRSSSPACWVRLGGSGAVLAHERAEPFRRRQHVGGGDEG